MAVCPPQLGSKELEAFAERQLPQRIADLVAYYRETPDEVKAEMLTDYRAVLQAHAKFKRNREDSPLTAGELLRVSVGLKKKMGARVAALEQARNPPEEAKKPQIARSDEPRTRALGSRGPHPAVLIAMQKGETPRDDLHLPPPPAEKPKKTARATSRAGKAAAAKEGAVPPQPASAPAAAPDAPAAQTPPPAAAAAAVPPPGQEGGEAAADPGATTTTSVNSANRYDKNSGKAPVGAARLLRPPKAPLPMHPWTPPMEPRDHPKLSLLPLDDDDAPAPPPDAAGTPPPLGQHLPAPASAPAAQHGLSHAATAAAAAAGRPVGPPAFPPGPAFDVLPVPHGKVSKAEVAAESQVRGSPAGSPVPPPSSASSAGGERHRVSTQVHGIYPHALRGFEQGRFPLADETSWKTSLQRYGWVVISGVVDAEKCDSLVDEFWQHREAMGTGLKRSDPSTWTGERWGGNVSGTWQKDGAGQEQWVWEARELCAPVFERIYTETELISSQEGFTALRGGQVLRATQWGVDQSISYPNFQCFQAQLALVDSGETDAGFCIGSGSKKSFASLAAHVNYTEVYKARGVWALRNRLLAEPIKVNCKKGDVIVWDSRSIHATRSSAHPLRQDPSGVQWLAVNLCMVPISLATKNTADRRGLHSLQAAARRKCVEEAKTTTHHAWTCQPIASSKHKGTPVYSLRQYQPPDLTPRMLQLAGLLPYSCTTPPGSLYSMEARNLMGTPSATIPRDSHLAGGCVSPADPAAAAAALLDDVCGSGPAGRKRKASDGGQGSLANPVDCDIDSEEDRQASPPESDDSETKPQRKRSRVVPASPLTTAINMHATETWVQDAWERLSGALCSVFSEKYRISKRSFEPRHLEMIARAGITEPDEALKETARDAVVEIWKISTQVKKAEEVKKGGVSTDAIHFAPLLNSIERLTRQKTDALARKAAEDPDIVARILEGRLRTMEGVSPTTPQLQSEASLLFTPVSTPLPTPAVLPSRTDAGDDEEAFDLGPSREDVLSAGAGAGLFPNALQRKAGSAQQDGISLAAAQRKRFAASLDDW